MFQTTNIKKLINLQAKAGMAAKPLVLGAISAQYNGASANAPAPPAPAATLAAQTPRCPHHAARDQLICEHSSCMYACLSSIKKLFLNY